MVGKIIIKLYLVFFVFSFVLAGANKTFAIDIESIGDPGLKGLVLELRGVGDVALDAYAEDSRKQLQNLQQTGVSGVGDVASIFQNSLQNSGQNILGSAQDLYQNTVNNLQNAAQNAGQEALDDLKSYASNYANNFLSKLQDSLGKGIGKIGGRDELSKKLADMASSGSIDVNNPESAADFILEESGLFAEPGEVLSNEKIKEILDKRKQLSKENINSLYSESLKIKKMIADGVFDKKMEKVSEYAEEGEMGGSETGGGGGEGEDEGDPDLTRIWRSNAISSIVQAETMLTLLELQLQELRTDTLSEMAQMSVRIDEIDPENIEVITETDVIGNVLEDEYDGNVDNYVDDYLKKMEEQRAKEEELLGL